MALDLEIQKLLRSSEVKQINFTLGGIRVSGFGFQELSKCFSVGPIPHRIRVTVRPQLLKPNSFASYDPINNKLHLRSANILNSPAGRSTVVHECTHAQIDLRALSTAIRSEEAAAHIASAWYLLAGGHHVGSVHPGFPNDIIQITNDIRNQSLQNPGTPIPLNGNQINTARRAMSHYPMRHYRSNGIRGLRYRGP